MSETKKDDLSVVVFANRKDFFISKLCIASIRFYYPDVEILLVKDRLNGDFNTATLCKVFNVKVFELGKRYFGWSAGKIFFLLNDKIPKKRYLCLDSDIIFIGNLLDKLNLETGDFVLHPEVYPQPFSDMVKSVFLDEEKIKEYYPEYTYPGFFFNAGQTVVTPGLLSKEFFLPSFNPDQYPYFRDQAIFPLVDQSILNIVIPINMKNGSIKVSTVPYMLWSVDFFKDPTNQSIEKFSNGDDHPFLVHYAGDVRTHIIKMMKGSEILLFFRKFYYSKLTNFEIRLDRIQDRLAAYKPLARILYYKNRVLLELRKKTKGAQG